MKERSPYDPYVDEAKKSLEVGIVTTSIILNRTADPLVKLLKEEYYRYPLVRKLLK